MQKKIENTDTSIRVLERRNSSVEMDAMEDIDIEVLEEHVPLQKRTSKPFSTPPLSSNLRTFGNTIIAFIGSGILGLPYAFQKAGFMLGTLTLFFVAITSTYAMMLLIRCKYTLKSRGIHAITYGQVGQAACGKFGAYAVDISLIVSQSGFCIAYLIFIARNVQSIFGTPQVIVTFACVPLLIALAFVKSLKNLAPFALFADVANMVGLAVVFFSDFEYMPLDHDEIVWANFQNFFFFFGVAIYCFEGVGMVFPLENSMQNKDKFTPLLLATVALITVMYGTFGLCGYLAFGNEVKDVITLNMPGSFLSKIVKISLCIGLYLAYPMMLFPVFQVLESYCIKKNTVRQQQAQGGMIRVGTVLCTAVVAVCIPNFGLFISFIGSTCCSLLAFILPTLFYYRICCGPKISITLGFLLSGIFLIGLLSMIIGIKDVLGHILTP